MVLTIGERLGPYQIIAKIGSGGMGVVYKAVDCRLGRTVALKQVCRPNLARFEREARAIAVLNHPHICTLHDVGPDYLIMEYLDGVPLAGPLSMNEAVRLALQIVTALEFAHAKGIIHRDLKPANVLVTPNDIKLLDFGLAKLMTVDPDATQTVEGTVLGTPAYMAPEQALGKPLDERSDIFSFGAVFYEMLTGRKAFPGASVAQTLTSILRDEPAAFEAPAEIVRIVTRCLRKSPAERFQTMTELKGALERLGAVDLPVRPSIAVLPFANLSPDRENEYFGDGLAEEIMNALAQVPGLKVIARTSAFAFKGK